MKSRLINKIRLEKTNLSPFFNNLVSGSLWSIIGGVLSKGFILLTWILVARILGKEQYGEFGIIRSTVHMFIVFAGFGLGLTATKHVAELKLRNPAKVSDILVMAYGLAAFLGLLIGVIFQFFAKTLALNSLNAPYLEGELRIAALILFISSVNGAQTGALQGFEAFKQIARINFLHGIISFFLYTIGTLLYDVIGAVVALALSLIVLYILNYVELQKQYKKYKIQLNFKRVLVEKGILVKFALPAALSGLMISPVRWIVETMLVREPNGYSEMGFFQAALVFQIFILTASKTINAPLLTSFTQINKGRQVDLQFYNIQLPWLIGSALILPLIVFPEYFGFIFGKDFVGSTLNINISIIAAFTSIILFKEGLSRVLIVNNLLWFTFISNLIWGMILFVSFLFFKNHGSIGLSFSYLLAYILNTIVILPIYQKKNCIDLRALFKPNVLLTLAMIIFGPLLLLIEPNFFLKAVYFFVSFGLIIKQILKEYYASRY